MTTIKLSDMSVGDIGYLPERDAIVRLCNGGKAGGAEHDLYLAWQYAGHKYVPQAPTIIIDTDNVSI